MLIIKKKSFLRVILKFFLQKDLKGLNSFLMVRNIFLNQNFVEDVITRHHDTTFPIPFKPPDLFNSLGAH